MLTPIAGEMAGKEMACQQAWDQHSMRKAAGSSESFPFLLSPCPDFVHYWSPSKADFKEED